MINGLKMLAIIPARAGSKGVKNKNIRMLGGYPLIYWAIRASLRSNYIDNVIVTTDSPEIKAISTKHRAEVPFLRPVELASDNVAAREVIDHTLSWYISQGVKYDSFIYLQPTSPFRSEKHINEA